MIMSGIAANAKRGANMENTYSESYKKQQKILRLAFRHKKYRVRKKNWNRYNKTDKREFEKMLQRSRFKTWKLNCDKFIN